MILLDTHSQAQTLIHTEELHVGVVSISDFSMYGIGYINYIRSALSQQEVKNGNYN